MNTRAMFEQAKGAKLSRPQLMAHTIWALVSQAGRKPMTVGEVCKMVLLTSGIQPSTYQMKYAMAELSDMWAAKFVDGGVKGKGRQVRYMAGERVIAALVCYSYALAGTGVHEAAMEVGLKLWGAQAEALQEIIAYNQSLDSGIIDT